MIENYTRYKNRNISLNYLLRVLPVFIIPVVVMVTIYISSNNIINQQTYQRNSAILENSAVTIQKTFNDMDNLISYLDHSPEINNYLEFINPIKDGATTMDLINVQSNLKSLTIANDIIANIQLYSKKNNILIDSSTSALFLKRYYEYKYINGVNFEDWESKYLNVRHKQDIITDTELVIGGIASKNIIYANSLPLSDSINLKGSVFIYLDEKYLIDQYKNIPYSDNGFICIIDKTGEVILYDGTFNMEIVTDNLDDFSNKGGYLIESIDGEDLFITYYNDTNRNWTYVAALPNVKVLEPTAKIRLYIGMLIVFTILVGGFLLFSSISKLSKPIKHFFSLIADRKQNLTYNDFEDEIIKLVENNKKMQESLNSQVQELRTSIFYNLLIGKYHDEELLLQNLDKIDIASDSKHYVVLIVSANELNINNKLEAISAQKIYINNILTSHFNNIQGMYNLDFDRTVILLDSNEQNSADLIFEIEEKARKVIDELMTSVMISISIAGDVTDNIIDSPSCFLNAYTALNYKHKDNNSNTVQWYNKTLEIDGTNFYYPIELESRIITLVNTGNVDKLLELFGKVEEKNRHIMTENRNYVFYKLLISINTTLIRIINDMQNNSLKLKWVESKITSKLDAKEDFMQIYYLLKEAFQSIAVNIKDEFRKNNHTQRSQILQYINEHYCEPQLSLASVADVFHITEVYLSHLFKNTFDENFSKYVEKLRMKKAIELIGKGFKINEIAKMVGYNSPQVFRRAYKRNYGVTPSVEVSCEKL